MLELLKRRAAFAFAALAAALLVGAGPAAAFCRSTTCTGDCPRDDDGCKTTGVPLAWPGICVGFSLNRAGTVNIPMDDVRLVVAKSFAEWSDRACGEGPASLAFSQLDDVSCHATEYNEHAPNTNVILFQDTKWTYHGPDDTLAKTTVTFDKDTGEILDADIEINHAYNEFTIGDDHVVYDLQAVLTHEIGHLLGLDHTADFYATMNAGYTEGSTDMRSVEADDLEGLCAVYPPGRSGKCDPTPRNGLADACGEAPVTPATPSDGCALAGPSDGTGLPRACLGLLLFAAFLGRRRWAPRTRSWFSCACFPSSRRSSLERR